MKNARNPHILRTLPFLHFFKLFKNFGDFIWLGWCSNRFITLRRWSNDLRKKSKSQNTKKIRQGTKNVKNPHILQIHPILNNNELFKNLGTSYALETV